MPRGHIDNKVRNRQMHALMGQFVLIWSSGFGASSSTSMFYIFDVFCAVSGLLCLLTWPMKPRTRFSGNLMKEILDVCDIP